MKLINTINFVPFYEKVKDQKMAIGTAYKLSKIYHKAKEDEGFYQDKLREILFKYGEVDENGNLIPTEDGKGVKLKPNTQEECLVALNELQSTESDLQFEPISIDELKDAELTPQDLEGIIEFLA